MPYEGKYDLEDRLIKFAILILEICDLNTRASNNLEHQLSKSGTAPALMYGEVQAAESRADFVHKMKMLLKELRETRISLRIINEKPIIKHPKSGVGSKRMQRIDWNFYYEHCYCKQKQTCHLTFTFYIQYFTFYIYDNLSRRRRIYQQCHW